MKEIRNLTKRPVRVPLPRGRTLHLGPAQVAQVADGATKAAGIQKLVDEGKIELVGDGEKVSTKMESETIQSRKKGNAKSVRRVQGDR